MLSPLAASGAGGPSCRGGQRPQPGDQRQDVGEHLPRDRDLGHLERDVAPVADDLRADLDELLAQAGQRPRLRRLRHRQRAHEVAEVVGERMELEADGVGGEGATGQPGPFDRAFAFLDPLLRRATLVVEADDALGGPRQVGHDKADTRVKLGGVPFDLGYDTAGLLPALRLIAEAGEVAPYLVRRSPGRALQQVSDLVLQDPVGRQSNRIAHALGFEELVDLGIGEGRVASEIKPLHPVSVAHDHRLQHRAPAIRAMDVTGSQSAPLDIAELVEHEQRVIAGAAEMAVIGAVFLIALGRALARIHVEHDGLRRSPVVHLVDPLAGKIGESSKVLGSAQPLRLEPCPSGWPKPQTR